MGLHLGFGLLFFGRSIKLRRQKASKQRGITLIEADETLIPKWYWSYKHYVAYKNTMITVLL